jgi:poly-gamma-glutamate capsule biosynthesis protein CapA/YwtB (metallophosphatase superfamily)
MQGKQNPTYRLAYKQAKRKQMLVIGGLAGLALVFFVLTASFISADINGNNIAANLAGISSASNPDPETNAGAKMRTFVKENAETKKAKNANAAANANINTGTIGKTNAESTNTAFTIAAVGDINCGGRVGTIIAGSGVDYPFKNVAGILSSVDIAVGNLECALSSRGKAVSGKEFTFRGVPECGPALRRAGFDALSIANNHSKDFGAEALEDTAEILEQSGIIFAGAGSNSTASYQPKISRIRETETAFAFVAFSDVVPPGFAATKNAVGVASARNDSKMLGAIEDVKAKAEFIIVSVHWGKELSTIPSARQTALAHRLIDLGADLVVGHHPHVVQGFEVYKGKLIAYSLGNFVFSPGNNLGRQSALLTAIIKDNKITAAHVYPVYIEGVRPKILTGKKGDTWLREIESRSRPLKTQSRIGTVRGQPIMKIRIFP